MYMLYTLSNTRERERELERKERERVCHGVLLACEPYSLHIGMNGVRDIFERERERVAVGTAR